MCMAKLLISVVNGKVSRVEDWEETSKKILNNTLRWDENTSGKKLIEGKDYVVFYRIKTQKKANKTQSGWFKGFKSQLFGSKK
jgi:hypothetical protein